MARDNSDIVMKCSRCPNSAPISEMRYAKDGKSLLCPACSGVKPAPVTTTPKRTELKLNGPATKYKCTACSFTFIRSTLKPNKCPYCGKESVVKMSEISSHHLLNE